MSNRSTAIELGVVYILTIIIAIFTTVFIQTVKYQKKIEALNVVHEEEIIALRTELQNDYEAQIGDLKRYYEYGGDVSQIELEAEYIAKVIYGTARNHSDADKRAIVWCIINRVEHHAHPDTIAEVCEQPKQWIGYSSDNPILTYDYELVLTELKSWHNKDPRPISNEYVYMTWSSEDIVLRDTFAENKNTHYWRFK